MGPEIRLCLLFWNDKYMSCLTKRQELLKRLFNRLINIIYFIFFIIFINIPHIK